MTGVGEEELYGSLLRAARAEPHALAIFCGPELPEGGYRALAELMTAGSVGLVLLSAPIESFIEARRRSGAGGFTVVEAVGPGGIPGDMDVDIPLLVKLRADHPGGELKPLDFNSSAGDWLSAAIDRCAVLALGWAGDEANAVSATATALRASSEVTRGVIWALPTESTAGHQLRELLASDLGQDGRVSLAEVADPVALLSRLAEALAEPREASVRFDPVVGGRVRGAELVGREHELRLASELLLSDFGVVVKGIPGIGKSALAGRLADLLEHDFESVLWWDCSQPGAAEVVVANLQDRWGRPLRQGPPDATSISEAIRERRVLCVFDDFESQVEVGSETFASSTWLTIFEALRRAPGCRSLVTTTDWRPPRETGDLQVLTLEGLEPEAASRLYSRFATERIDEPNVDELVDELGGHPLELIGAALAGECHPSRGDRGPVLPQPRLVKAIERVLRRLSPAEAEAMVRLSVMRSRTPPEAFEWLGIALPATKLLQARSLVTGMSDGSLEVHASIARAIFACVSRETRLDAHARAAGYFVEAARLADRRLVESGDREAGETWSRYLYHAISVWAEGGDPPPWQDFDWVVPALAGGAAAEWRMHLARAVEPRLLGGRIEGPAMAVASCLAGAALHEAGDRTASLALCQVGLERAGFEPTSTQAIECLLAAAECLMDAGRAIEVEQRFSAALEDAPGDAPRARMWLWLGKARYRLGRVDDALAAYAEARALDRELRLGEKIALAGFTSNALFDKGKLDEAHAEAMGALRTARVSLNEREVATQMVNLALVSRRMGRQLEADEFCGSAARIYERLGYRRGLGTTWRIQANSSRDRGKLDAAAAEIEKSLACHRAVGYRRGEAVSSGVAAEIAAERGRVTDAEAFFGRAIALSREIGDERSLAINLLGSGKLVSSNPKRVEEARQQLIEARAIALSRGLKRVLTDAEAALVAAVETTASAIVSGETDGSGQSAPEAILLVTTTDVETTALKEALANEGLDEFVYDPVAGYARVGVSPRGRPVCVLRNVQMGAVSAGGALLSIYDAARALGRPTVVLVGIAFGVDDRRQAIGDVLVANRVVTYERQRVGTSADGGADIRLRGEQVDAHPRPLRSFYATVQATRAQRVEFGTLLSGEKLIDNVEFRRQLETLVEGAVGGEMEGTGLYAVAAFSGLEWGCIKAICDFADGKKSLDKSVRQACAAKRSSEFAVQSLAFL